MNEAGQDLTPAERAAAGELLRAVFGSACRMTMARVARRDHAYAVIIAELNTPERAVAIKLAGAWRAACLPVRSDRRDLAPRRRAHGTPGSRATGARRFLSRLSLALPDHHRAARHPLANRATDLDRGSAARNMGRPGARGGRAAHAPFREFWRDRRGGRGARSAIVPRRARRTGRSATRRPATPRPIPRAARPARATLRG